MSKVKIKAIRGMHDILPEDGIYWHYVETAFRECVESYGYREIRTPILETTNLFKRGVGETTDIVEKEMYTFTDRNNESVTLRPEGTASVVRAGIEHSLFYKQTQRLWYTGPNFRYERPQKGRYRQFYQLGAEAFGMSGPDIDIELLFLSWRFWQRLGLAEFLTLEINSLGTFAERQQYNMVLVTYFEQHLEQLDEDSQNRLHENPLRILDSKNSEMRALIEKAPLLTEFLSMESQQRFTQICTALDALQIPYFVNPRLVRGLDYYCHLVFEWVSDQLGAQGTVCAGGRYDSLVTQLGGEEIPAAGFGMGIERLILLLKEQALRLQNNVAIYLINVCVSAEQRALLLAEQIHTLLPQLSVLNNCGGGSFKSQMKRADKSGAKIALILGDDELANKKISIKYLREKREQETIALVDLPTKLQQTFSEEN